MDKDKDIYHIYHYIILLSKFIKTDTTLKLKDFSKLSDDNDNKIILKYNEIFTKVNNDIKNNIIYVYYMSHIILFLIYKFNDDNKSKRKDKYLEHFKKTYNYLYSISNITDIDSIFKIIIDNSKFDLTSKAGDFNNDYNIKILKTTLNE